MAGLARRSIRLLDLDLDLDAAAQALDGGRLAGLGLDVFAPEPPRRSGGSVPLQAAARAVRSTVIVVDASVVAAALADDGHDGEAVRTGLRGERLAPRS